MIFDEFNILRRHGRQSVPDLRAVELTPVFRGRPFISDELTREEIERVVKLCPTNAIEAKHNGLFTPGEGGVRPALLSDPLP